MLSIATCKGQANAISHTLKNIFTCKDLVLKYLRYIVSVNRNIGAKLYDNGKFFSCNIITPMFWNRLHSIKETINYCSIWVLLLKHIVICFIAFDCLMNEQHMYTLLFRAVICGQGVSKVMAQGNTRIVVSLCRQWIM